MPRIFYKPKEGGCGCVIKTIICGSAKNNDKVLWLIGGHSHLIICKKCSEAEETEDTLYDVWIQDNKTDDNGYGGWKEMEQIPGCGQVFEQIYENIQMQHI